MKETVIKKVNLKNGLELIFFDDSKRIAGDRWHVEILARISIRIDSLFQFGKMSNPIIDQDMKKIMGETVCFEKKLVRIFVDEKEKDSVVMNVCESYLSSAGDYLSHKNFAERFVRKIYRETLEKRQIDNLIKKGMDDGG
jgi:hypothetical protein